MGRLKLLVMVLATAFSLRATALVSTYSPGTNRNDFTGYVGMKFVATSFTVGQLGLRCASSNSGNHNVYLLDGSNATLASATISLTSCTTGTFYYANVSSVALSNATTYYLCTQTTNGDGQNWADKGAVTLSSLGSSAVAIFSSTLGSFSNSTSGQSYAGVDVTDVVSGATTPRLSLLGVGFALLNQLFWRSR